MKNHNELLKKSHIENIKALLKSCNDISMLDLIEKILTKATKENDRQCNN